MKLDRLPCDFLPRCFLCRVRERRCAIICQQSYCMRRNRKDEPSTIYIGHIYRRTTRERLAGNDAQRRAIALCGYAISQQLQQLAETKTRGIDFQRGESAADWTTCVAVIHCGTRK